MDGPDQPTLSEAEWGEWWRDRGAEELRTLLFWRWDPIGVANFFPDRRHAYDDEAAPIVRKLKAGASAREIEAYLAAREEELGRASVARRGRVAQALVDWYQTSVAHWRAAQRAARQPQSRFW